MEPPIVIHVVISLQPGGLERLVVDWTNARNREYAGSTRIICLDELGQLASQVEGDVLRCLHARRRRFPWDRAAVVKLMAAAEEFLTSLRHSNTPTLPQGHSLAPGLIFHAHNLAAWQYAVLAAGRNSAPVIYTQHGINPHDFKWLNIVRWRWLVSRTTAMVAVAQSVADAMQENQGIPGHRIQVVPNGIAMPRPCGETDALLFKRNMNISNGDLVIGSVGRLSFEKGHDRLIRAFGQLVKRASGYRGKPVLLIVGDGPAREALSRLVDEQGLVSHVRLAGYQADMRSLYKAMDIFVLPSRSEGLSLALLEAMAAGLPVAVTGAGESAKIVERAGTGFVLPDDEALWPEVMGEILCREVNQDELDRGRTTIQRDFAMERTMALYHDLYLRTAKSCLPSVFSP